MRPNYTRFQPLNRHPQNPRHEPDARIPSEQRSRPFDCRKFILFFLVPNANEIRGGVSHRPPVHYSFSPWRTINRANQSSIEQREGLRGPEYFQCHFRIANRRCRFVRSPGTSPLSRAERGLHLMPVLAQENLRKFRFQM